MEEPGFWDDPEKSTRMVREAKNLKDDVETYRELDQEYDDIQVMIQMGYEENDASVIPDIQEMLDHFIKTLEDMRLKLLLSGEYDKNNAILRLNAGAGGTESCDWCSTVSYTHLADPENLEIQHNIILALRANYLMFRDKDYVVKDGEVLIVDEFTGRIMPGRRYSDGLHQAIEAKEHVSVRRESRTLATITFQNFFNKFKKKAGMTGTAQTEEKEFRNIYSMDVITIPTNRPMIRKDMEDAVYKTKKEKYKAVVESVQEAHDKGQPVLVGTIAIETSELLSNMLRKRGIPHKVLNAKFHELEAEIVADAGIHGAVTIATNMAGRGTDIKLDDESKALGGLKIIGTERHCLLYTS